MSNQLLQQLEIKVDQAVESIEIMRLQIEELEEKNTALQKDNNILKDKQETWEKTLHSMLNKLNSVDSALQDAEKSMSEY